MTVLLVLWGKWNFTVFAIKKYVRVKTVLEVRLLKAIHYIMMTRGGRPALYFARWKDSSLIARVLAVLTYLNRTLAISQKVIQFVQQYSCQQGRGVYISFNIHFKNSMALKCMCFNVLKLQKKDFSCTLNHSVGGESTYQVSNYTLRFYKILPMHNTFSEFFN